MDLPKEAAELSATMTALAAEGVSIERGQRYAIHRGVAFVPVRGVLTPNSAILERYLGWATYHGIAETMAAVTASDEVQATVMIYDTAGGAVMGIQAAVEAVKAAAMVKPVHGVVHPLAASAGYWVASQCTDISLTPGSWVGSVGTMMTADQPVQPGLGGFQYYILTSEHAGAKRPDLSTDEGKALAQTRLDTMEADFLSAVAEGRNIAAADVPGRMSRTDNDRDGGDVFWGADAIERGLADVAETVPEFMARIGGLYAPKPRPNKSRAYLARAEAAKAAASL
ncbi:S49 family peptidase [Leisingera sp. M523]|uniref:S49 family peptidase n=1 Tax=Leisingera sp. M523 TaxID=2867013 RepID=UPI002882D8C0|nr:S49 family peptidase [Leisingera sp. M523]